MQRRIELGTGERTSARRRGMAVIFVLGLLSMTLAVSYALVRSQVIGLMGQANFGRRADARQAAYTGLSAALQRMHQSSWTGVDTSLTGTLGTDASYAAAYTTGDPELTAASTDAGDWPYRTTITTTGYAVDASTGGATTTYALRAVVRLAPRQLAANPSAWSTMLPFVVFQTDTDAVSLQLPFRFEGPVRLQGSLSIASSYPSPSNCRLRYFGDLNAMRSDGFADFRPFDGPVTLPFASTGTSTRSLLTTTLGITLTDGAGAATSNWNAPGSTSTYRLYPGGRTYTAVALASAVSGTTLAADPRTNPAGIFLRQGDVSFGANTTIVGTVVSTGDVTFNGANISITPELMAPLDGTTVGHRLPAVVAADDVYVQPGASAAVFGNVVAFDDFESLAGTQATTFDLRGRLIARHPVIGSRSEWNSGSFLWSIYWTLFGDLRVPEYLPAYMQRVWGMSYTPRLTVRAWSDPAASQWYSPSSPLYSIPSGDPGLRWTLMKIRELP